MALITNKSIFYHIPKTGGTWVGFAMRNSMKDNKDFKLKRTDDYHDKSLEGSITDLLGLDKAHVTPWKVADKQKKGLFSFAIIRKPFEWYRSWWVNRTYVYARKKDWREFLLDYAFDPNFEQFIENAIEMFPMGALTFMYQNYLGQDGKLLDFVGRQENLAEDTIKALKKAGEEFNEDVIRHLEKVNTSKSRNLDSPLDIDSSLKRKLNRREKWILDKFYDD